MKITGDIARAMKACHYPDIPDVAYKAIDRFPGYCFGDDGVVWTQGNFGPRSTRRLSPAKEWKKKKPDKIRGRHFVRLVSRDGVSRKYPVSALILEAFVGPCPKGMESCHFPDPCLDNNRLDNLRWGTKKENARHRIIHGNQARGTGIWLSKMTPDKVVELRMLRASGWTYKKLGHRFGISDNAASDICRRKTWAHIQSEDQS